MLQQPSILIICSSSGHICHYFAPFCCTGNYERIILCQSTSWNRTATEQRNLLLRHFLRNRWLFRIGIRNFLIFTIRIRRRKRLFIFCVYYTPLGISFPYAAPPNGTAVTIITAAIIDAAIRLISWRFLICLSSLYRYFLTIAQIDPAFLKFYPLLVLSSIFPAQDVIFRHKM